MKKNIFSKKVAKICHFLTSKLGMFHTKIYLMRKNILSFEPSCCFDNISKYLSYKHRYLANQSKIFLSNLNTNKYL